MRKKQKRTGLNRRKFLKYSFCSTLVPGIQPALWLSGCSKQKSNGPNLILISIDTLRADHLGCYGYQLDTSPNIDLFAADSIRYSKAFAPSSWTLPSHAAMLTGFHPYILGMNSTNSTIPKRIPLLAELLKDYGFHTGAIVDSGSTGFVGRSRGFDRGFGSFIQTPAELNTECGYDIADTVKLAQKWFKKRNKSKPFFLFLHTMSVHSAGVKKKSDSRHLPYAKPEKYLSRFLTPDLLKFSWDPSGSKYLLHYCELLSEGNLKPSEFPPKRLKSLVGQYDAGIFYTDEYLGRLLAFFKNMGIFEDTVFIITSDHGESFLEHRLFLHNEVYNQALQVPLIIKLPGSNKEKVIDTPVNLMDIVPTILNITGIPASSSFAGKQLQFETSNNNSKRKFFGYYLYKKKHFYDGFSLQKDDTKAIVHKYANGDWIYETYNISKDPKETLLVTNAKTDLHKELLGWIASNKSSESLKIQLDSDTKEKLKSLGYAQ